MTSPFIIDTFSRFYSENDIAGIPITSSQPTDGQILSFNPTINEFEYVTGSGAAGLPGDTGDPGDDGPKGMNGAKGNMGIQGPAGAAGAPGAAGANGAKGPVGTTGAVGLPGIPAPAPVQGPQGPTGPQTFHRIADVTTTAQQLCYDPVYITAATDNFLIGPQTTEGAGTKLYFINNAANGAFRAGAVNGTQWNLANRGTQATVGMGLDSTSNAQATVVAGGSSCEATFNRCFCGAGVSNRSNQVTCAILGGGGVGAGNRCTGAGVSSFIGGGQRNLIQVSYGVILGGGSSGASGNLVGTAYSVIGAGSQNSILSSSNSMIWCGTNNNMTAGAGGGNSAIVAGANNVLNGTANTNTFIGGGQNNSITGTRSAILCGNTNVMGPLTGATDSLIACGQNNTINHTSASATFIMCGQNNSVTLNGWGSYIFNGNGSTVNNSRCHVYGSNVTTAGGQVCVISDGNPLTTAGTSAATTIAMQGGVYFYSNAARTTGVQLLPSANAWSAVCDRTKKENIVEVDYDDIASKLVDTVKVYEFTYKDDDTKQIWRGPMAQDWYEAFPSPGKSKHLRLDTMDVDGIKLAAIRSLGRRSDAMSCGLSAMTEKLRKIETAILTEI